MLDVFSGKVQSHSLSRVIRYRGFITSHNIRPSSLFGAFGRFHFRVTSSNFSSLSGIGPHRLLAVHYKTHQRQQSLLSGIQPTHPRFFITMADIKEEPNTIQGTNDLTLTINDIRSLDSLAQKVLSTPNLSTKTISISIKTELGEDDDATYWGSTDKAADETLGPQAQEEEKELSDTEKRIAHWDALEKKGERRATVLCKPLTDILSTLSSQAAALKHFSWTAEYYHSTRFRRPQAFWDALFAHAKTLESLRLDYFEHEVLHVCAPETTFSVLKSLTLDTSSAHGDKGVGIDGLLKACPNLEALDFSWPGCDLEGCQIQDISWDYTYSSLTRLRLRGWPIKSAPVAAFISRHPLVTTFSDGVDSEVSDKVVVGTTDLPKLSALKKMGHSESGFTQYFDDKADRPLRHVSFCMSWGSARALKELVGLPRATSQLKVLEFEEADVLDWRIEEEDSDDSEEEEEEGKEKYVPPPRLCQVLKEQLAELHGLRELGVSMESSNTHIKQKDGKYKDADPATGEDLKFLLTHIPANSTIRALRVWDSVAEPLAQDLLDDFPAVPDALEYFAWQAKEKSLYKLIREHGKVRAEKCEDVRVKKGDAEDWTEERILDYQKR